nr:conserved hypothetical protein [Albugo laibachii Nc14]|eukprot:CCA15371.1 conserved hypothetical protein [Albugo laibachii Nc14]
MQLQANLTLKKGKIICNACKAKLGSWNWHGIKCSCNQFIKPSFQLVPSRTEQRNVR